MDVTSLLNTRSSSAAGSDASRKAQENQDRFLTLLVAQMRNQDPMNPMENAQLTTQIAQIQTVTGVDQLNTNIEKLGQQFNQGQLAGAVSLVGRKVTLSANRLVMGEKEAVGLFELSGSASKVKVEVMTPAGKVLDTVDLGAATAGRHAFTWSDAGYTANRDLRFRIVASKGSAQVSATTFTRDQVTAINTKNGQLQLELASGQRSEFGAIVSVD